MVPLTFLRKKPRAAYQLLLAALIFAGCGTCEHLTRAPPIFRVLLRLILAFICNKCRRVQNDTGTNWQAITCHSHC